MAFLDFQTTQLQEQQLNLSHQLLNQHLPKNGYHTISRPALQLHSCLHRKTSPNELHQFKLV
jgi:hypothetical protein